jgi:sulfate permease, SulP family
VLWTQGDEPDGLYIIESGVLRAVYHFAAHTPDTEESMVAGTVAGELSALSESPRNATCVVERHAVVWKLTLENLRKMEGERPELARTFVKLLLKGRYLSLVTGSCADNVAIAAKIDYDILLSALATRQ